MSAAPASTLLFLSAPVLKGAGVEDGAGGNPRQTV